MLKFLKKEQESCSQMCPSNAQSRSKEQVSQSPDTSLVAYHKCTNSKSTNSIKINKKLDHLNLPCLSVCLKDLRFTWPNLNLGTVKLNLNKKDNVHLSDQLLHCINTRSKKKTYGCFRSHHSTRQRLLFSSALSKLRLQRAVTELKGSTVKNGLHGGYTQTGRQLEMTSKCCLKNFHASQGKTMAVIKNVIGCANENQNGLKPNRKHRRKSGVSSSTSCVNLGKLIKHFLKSEANGFAELLNQKEKSLKKNGKSGLCRNIDNMSIFNSSLSDCQTVDFARELNSLANTFPREKKYFVRNSPATIDDGIAVSVGVHAHVLGLKDCESTETESNVQEKIADLPHNTLKITSKNVNCNKKSQFCLPANLKCSAPQMIVDEKPKANKRRISQDRGLESTISPKRYTGNILGICKLCDVSHGLSSCQNQNLFCKCTIQKNSGILKNLKAEGVTLKNTTEQIKNAHLKVVVERLADSKLLATSTINCKGVCKLKNTNLCNREIEANVLNVSQKRPNLEQSTKGPTNHLISTVVAKANYAGVETLKSVTKVSTPTTSSNSSYFSPIKLMFVSKVENKDGVKYTLSSEYPPLNKPGDAKLSTCVIKTCDNRKKKAPPSSPENKASAQIGLTKLLFSTDQSHCERKTSSRKASASQIESQHKRCSRKISTKQSDFSCFANQMAKSKIRCSKLGKSRIAETYVVQNKGSDTQLRIKKVKRILRSSERILQKRESKALSLQRISERLKQRRFSNVSGMCRTNSSTSHQGGKTLVLPFQEAFTKYTERESDPAKKNQDQKTVTKQKWGSLLIRKLRCSNYETRSRKPQSSSFSSLPSPTFSVRSALCHESKKLYLDKCRIYRRKLRGHKQQCKMPLVDTTCTSNKEENCTENISLQPSTVLKWWSASTSKECLLKDLDTKYERVANTWLGKNNRENYNEVQSFSTLKVCNSEKRSPVQMLFQKKCDLGDLAAWFMQTTETQSLSIGRKAIAQSPLQKINRKGRITKENESIINSLHTKKHFKNCGLPTQSETLPKLLNHSKISKGNRKAVQNVNLNNMTHQNNEVCVKFPCHEKPVNVPKAYGGNASSSIRLSAQEIAQSVNIEGRSGNCQGAAIIANSIMDIGSLGFAKKENLLVKNKCKSKPKVLNMHSSSKQNIQDCKVYLTKLDVETKMSCAYRQSPSGNTLAGNKSNLKLGWRLERGFTRKYCLRKNKSVARSSHTLSRMENSTSKKCKFGMCLRKSKGPGASYKSKSLILERPKRLSKMTLFVETRAMRSKPPIPNIGKIPSDCQKFLLGSVKPAGIPAIRGLSSRGDTYSLTPFRIPLQ